MPRSWGYRTLRVAGGWRSAPLAFRPASFARRVGSKLGQALPQHLWPTPNQHVSSYNPRPLAPYSVNSHVIPLRLLQTLNLHRWNCNVFPLSRKITVLNYVRNLSGSGLPSPAVVAARPSHRLRALRPGPIVVGSSAPSMPEAVEVLQQKPRRGAPLMVQFPRLVVVKLDLRLVWCPKCSPPRRITVKMGCCGRSGLRFGHNCVGHGVCPPRACALT